MNEAPYVRHAHWTQAVLDICAPEWLPSAQTVALLHLPGEDVTRLVEFAANRGRGLCLRCSGPILLQPLGRPRLTCSNKCRKLRSRASVEARHFQRRTRIDELLAELEALDMSDTERRARHEKLMALREGALKPPPRPHGKPRRKFLDDFDHGWSFVNNVRNLAAHERKVLREQNERDRELDKETDKWLLQNEK